MRGGAIAGREVVLIDMGAVKSLVARDCASAPNSIFISLPCRELGGGGFFLAEADGTGERGDVGRILFRSSGSSGSEISCEVLGVSCNIVSKIDWRDTELASVLLAPSGTGACGRVGILVFPVAPDPDVDDGLGMFA